MESSVQRIAIFARALGAHRKVLHRCRRTIVGERFDDREPWAAVRAVREWISISAILRIPNILQALRTGSHIWHHQDRLFAAAALPNLESVESGRIENRTLDSLDERNRRLLFFHSPAELLQPVVRSFYLQEHAGCRITDPSPQLQLFCEPVDKR